MANQLYFGKQIPSPGQMVRVLSHQGKGQLIAGAVLPCEGFSIHFDNGVSLAIYLKTPSNESLVLMDRYDTYELIPMKRKGVQL